MTLGVPSILNSLGAQVSLTASLHSVDGVLPEHLTAASSARSLLVFIYSLSVH